MGELWDWITLESVAASTFALAIGTFVLALATMLMAAWTRRAANATRESVAVSHRLVESASQQVAEARVQSQLTQDALLASVRPLLSVPPYDPKIQGRDDVVLEWHGIESYFEDSQLNAITVAVQDRNEAFISVPFINIGAGVAVVTEARLFFGDHVYTHEHITSAIMPGGGRSRVSFALPKQQDDQLTCATAVDIAVEVSYTNIYGSDGLVTRARIRWFMRSNRHVATEHLIRRADDGTLLASSGDTGYVTSARRQAMQQ